MLSFRYLGYHVSVLLLDSSYPDPLWQFTFAPPTPLGPGMYWHGPLSDALRMAQGELWAFAPKASPRALLEAEACESAWDRCRRRLANEEWESAWG